MRSSRWKRLFSTTPVSQSALFNLGRLAVSRESQYLSKEHGIPRTEYSANAHLIRSSEVDPYAPAPGATREATRAAALKEAVYSGSESHLVRFKTIWGLAHELEETKEELRRLRESMRMTQAKNRNDTSTSKILLLGLLSMTSGATAYYYWTNPGQDQTLSAVVVPSQTTPLSTNYASQVPVEEAPVFVAPPKTQQDSVQEVTENKSSQSWNALRWLRFSFWAPGGR